MLVLTFPLTIFAQGTTYLSLLSSEHFKKLFGPFHHFQIQILPQTKPPFFHKTCTQHYERRMLE